MGAAFSVPSAAFSTSAAAQADISPVLFLATEVNELAARRLLKAAVVGNVAGLKEWGRNLVRAAEGLEAAMTMISDNRNESSGLLHLAAAMGDTDTCYLLILFGHHNVNASIHGITPLLAAIKGRASTSVVELLLKKNAEADILDNNGNTALHIALERGYCEIVELLLSHGSRMNLPCQTGEFPLQIATRNRNTRLLKLLLQHDSNGGDHINAGRPKTPLGIAAAEGYADCIDCLLEFEANANIPAHNDRLPIEIAASKGSIECVNRLFPVTSRLPTYEVWTVEAIMRKGQDDGIFWDTQQDHSRTIATEWKTWDTLTDLLEVVGQNPLSTDSSKVSEKEKERNKGIVSLLHGNIDKIITFLGPLSFLALIYSYGGEKKEEGKLFRITDGVYHFLCVGTVLSFSGLVLIHGLGSFYKELGSLDSIGFQVCSVFVFAANCYLIFIMGAIILGIERSLAVYVVTPGIVMVIAMMVLWPLFLKQPKFLIGWIKGVITR